MYYTLWAAKYVFYRSFLLYTVSRIIHILFPKETIGKRRECWYSINMIKIIKKLSPIALFILLIMMILSSSIKPAASKDKHDGFSIASNYSFSTVGIYLGEIYFIGEGNKLYIIDEHLDHAHVFIDEEMKLFSFADDYFLYVDVDDDLHIIYILGSFTKPMTLNVKDFRDSIIFNKGIVYQSEDGTLNSLTFIDWKITTIVEDTVLEFEANEGSIFFEIDSGKPTQANTLMTYSPQTGVAQKITRKHMQTFIAHEDYVYYVRDYSLYRVKISSRISKRLIDDNGIVNFGVAGDKILYMTNKPGLVMCDLDGENVIKIDDRTCNVIDSRDEIFLYYVKEDSNIVIVSEDLLTEIEIDSRESLLNCGFIGDFVFTSLGQVTDGGQSIIGFVLYDMDGVIVYKQ